MCEHCGCRGVEPIARLMDEHYRLLDLSGRARGHLAAGDQQAATALLREMGDLLGRHTRREEDGVFAALKADGEFADAVLELEGEHDDLDAALGALDAQSPDFAARVEVLLADLAEHIEKENLGVFPVAVVTLSASGWDLVSRAEATSGV